ncbi:MAG TPA: hypothetical protein VJS92_08895 [Candidatus Polarisedimenticolaceae bacterium]|nr:hypothetical protein [Candidatus Polarisedimenticolaceae bacterium]
MTDQAPTKNIPGEPQDAARRRLLKAAAVALPLIVTLRARPLFATSGGSTPFYDYNGGGQQGGRRRRHEEDPGVGSVGEQTTPADLQQRP